MTTRDAGPHPPKILHVILSLSVGGAETLVNNMVRHPAFAANKPVVCCLRTIGALGEKLRQDGFTVYCRATQPSGVDWHAISWVRGIIKAENIDIVHAHQYPGFFYAVPAAILSGRTKVVYTEHGRLYPDVRNWKHRLINPLLALGVDHIVSISASTAKAMADIDNLPLGRIKVIHNGVDFSRMNPQIDRVEKCRELGLNEASQIIGTAARLEQIKNIPMILRAFKLLLQETPNIVLIIAGEGSQEEYLKTLVSELSIADHVKFVGLRFDMPDIYMLLDVFLLTSFTEGVSVTLLESMASGIPAVVTDVGGNPEIVVDGVTGFLVPLNDDICLTDKIASLLKNSRLREELGRNSQQRAVEHFSFDAMIKAYTQLYGKQ